MPFGPTHDLIKTLANWGLNSYYSSIIVSNPQHVPPKGPVIIASNHWNMTIDPAMLSTRMPHGRRIHYWAKNTLFKNPIVNYVLLDAGNIPVDRTSKNNQLLFKGTFDVLKLGECVALFPEGTSYTQPKVIQVKDGIAWTALEYAKNLRLTGQELSGSKGTASGLTSAPEEVEDVKVIVCGLNYTHKTRYRSSIQLEYSPPLTLNHALITKFMTAGEEKLAVKEFIRTIEDRLRQVTINSDDWETLWCVWIVREFIWQDGLGPLHQYRHNMQQLVNLFTLKEDSSPTLKTLRDGLLRYHHLLKEADSSHLLFCRAFPTRRSQARWMVELSRCMIFWPFFILPAFLHIPVYVGAYLGSLLQPLEPESMDQNKVVLGLFTGLAVVPIYAGILAKVLLSYQSTITWSMRLVAIIISLGLVILAHVLHDGMVDTIYQSWKRLRLCWKLNDDQVGKLWELRQQTMEDWRNLCGELDRSHDPILHSIRLSLAEDDAFVDQTFESSEEDSLNPIDDHQDLDPPKFDEQSLLIGKKTQ